VLVTGLPGDLDSEKAYTDELLAWLDLVTSGVPTQRIIVLCDNPALISLPANSSARVLKADRASFLELGQVAVEATNGLTVIVWGHGGGQGNIPVFHVRGPRLMPRDFKTVADKSPGPSRWVLLFRGSGAFARDLAGENREILSSELDNMFTSDPIGMPLLIDLVKAKSEASFGQLADEFGRAVSNWYAERSLARTEEPTVWLDSANPRRLVTAETKEAEAAGQKSETQPSTQEAARPSTSSSNLPPVWKELHPVDPRNYPEADGIVLRKRLNYTLGVDPAITSEQEEFLQIFSAEGKRYGDFDVEYSPPSEEVSFQDCEVLRPGGELVRLDPEGIREGRDSSVGDYQTSRRKFFSLPGVVPGAILHVRYKTQWKKFPLPQVSLSIPLGSELAVVEAAVQVSVPKEVAFHYAVEQTANVEVQTNQSDYATTYAWKFQNLTARPHEPLMGPDEGPRLSISTFPDWKAFSQWYGRISQLTDEATPEIENQAKELAGVIKDPNEKVRAVYDFVTRLRYVAVPLGINSVRPHGASQVLTHQYGDCKDKANLFNALLRALNLEAHLVLVPRFSQALEAVPGLAFNHAISCVKLGGETLWVDTTDDVCRFGLLPPGDAGRNVLVIDGTSDKLTALPRPQAKDHRLQIRASVDCSNPGGALPISLSAQAIGYPDYELRTSARAAKEHGVGLPLLGFRYRATSGVLAVETQIATSPSALGEDFTWRAQGTLVGSGGPIGDTWLLRAPMWLPREWDLALGRRQSPLYLNQGYPLTLDEEIEVSLPATSDAVRVPEPTANESAPLPWRMEWVANGPAKLTARLHAQLESGELSLSETPRFQEQLRGLLNALSTGAMFAVRSGR
jgi:hypothetical protein